MTLVMGGSDYEIAKNNNWLKEGKNGKQVVMSDHRQDVYRLMEAVKPGSSNGSYGDNVKNVSKDIINNFSDGIEENKSIIEDATKKVIETVPEITEDTMAIHSPSEVMKKLGFWTDKGYEVGILENMDLVRNAVRTMLENGKVTEDELKELIGWDTIIERADGSVDKLNRRKKEYTNLQNVLKSHDTYENLNIKNVTSGNKKKTNKNNTDNSTTLDVSELKKLFMVNGKLMNQRTAVKFLKENYGLVVSEIDNYIKSYNASNTDTIDSDNVFSAIFGAKHSTISNAYADYMPNQITNIKKSVDSLKGTYDKLYLTSRYYPDEFLDKLQNIKTEIDLIDINNIVDVDDIEKANKKIVNLSDALKDIKDDYDILAPKPTAADESANISEYLRTNTRIGSYNEDKLNSYLTELNNPQITKTRLNEIREGFARIREEVSATNKAGLGLVGVLKNKIFYTFAQQIASYFSFRDIINYARQGVQTIISLDTALVDLKKTTKMSVAELNNFYKSSNKIAQKMGVTTEEIINQASAFSRLGYSSYEASVQMAELSSQFAAISPDMDVDTATDGLVSIMKAFDVDTVNVEREILDNINIIGNTAATSNGEIVDMLKRSSAAMKEANNSLEETIALETAAIEITRNAETTGTAFKTISMRIRGKSLPPYTVMYMLCA